MLPLCFDARRGVKNKSMILVVSPLKALMMDQVSAIRRLVLSAVCVTDKECTTNSEVTEGLQKGEYQIVFISPEVLFLATEWKTLLGSEFTYLI